MQIPDSFFLGSMQWDVVKVKKLDTPESVAECDPLTAEIRLSNIKKRSVLEQAFCHELVHAILFSMGYADAESDHDEEFVDSFAVFLHQYLNQQSP